jgi:putative nucleotidyltransferase with HDIG domain
MKSENKINIKDAIVCLSDFEFDPIRFWFHGFDPALSPIYLVGGAVRDLLLSKPPKDMDFVCNDAKGVAKRLGRLRNASVVPFEKKADQPCYRIVDRLDPSNHIDIAEIQGATIGDDLNRRDFTINAMGIAVEENGKLGTLIDPLGGARDLDLRIIRATGPDVFTSDPLRILRAVRFAAELDFEIEEKTLNLIGKNTHRLDGIAFERITAELLHILGVSRSFPYMLLLDRLGALEILFPEITAMKGCPQNSYHHKEVWQHSLLVLENCEEILDHLSNHFTSAADSVQNNLSSDDRLPLLKLSALLHDIGKPDTRSTDETSGRITFYGHDRSGAEMMRKIALRLKLSNKAVSFLETMVAEHLHILDLSRPAVNHKTLLRWIRKLGDDIVPSVILGMADSKGTLGPASSDTDRDHHLAWSQNFIKSYFEKLKPELERKDLISGNDLMALGIRPGIEIGQILKTVREAQDEGTVTDRSGAMDLAQKLSSEKNS